LAVLCVSAHRLGVSRSWFVENVVVGISSRGGRGRSSGTISDACFSKTHVPGSIGGHETETPVRLTRRQKRMPMRRLSPPVNRMLWSGRRISTV
jgi:hypothetical protein